MMVKRGKTPSLISGSAGYPRFVTAKKKRLCKRCGQDILKGTRCVEVPNPTNWSRRTYCESCLSRILHQTRQDLENLEHQLRA